MRIKNYNATEQQLTEHYLKLVQVIGVTFTLDRLGPLPDYLEMAKRGRVKWNNIPVKVKEGYHGDSYSQTE